MRRRNPASRVERGSCGNRTVVSFASRFSIARPGHAEPWRMASCSSGLKRHVQKLGGGLSMFEAFGNHAEGERLHTRDSLITVGAVAHDAGERGYFSHPPAIVFALKLDGKGHPRTVASGPAVQQPNGAVAPRSRAIMSPRRAAHLARYTDREERNRFVVGASSNPGVRSGVWARSRCRSDCVGRPRTSWWFAPGRGPLSSSGVRRASARGGIDDCRSAEPRAPFGLDVARGARLRVVRTARALANVLSARSSFDGRSNNRLHQTALRETFPHSAHGERV